MFNVGTLIDKRLHALRTQQRLSKHMNLDDKHRLVITWQENIPSIDLPVWGQEAYEGSVYSDDPNEAQVVKFSIVPCIDESKFAFVSLWLYAMGLEQPALPLRLYFRFSEEYDLQVIPADTMTDVVLSENDGEMETENMRRALTVILYAITAVVAGGPGDEIPVPVGFGVS